MGVGSPLIRGNLLLVHAWPLRVGHPFSLKIKFDIVSRRRRTEERERESSFFFKLSFRNGNSNFCSNAFREK